MATEETAPLPPQNSTRESKPAFTRIPSLDGLRGISVLAVLFAHATKDSAQGSRLSWHVSAQTGAWGVLCFFVISGYLITHLLRREWERSDAIDLRAFYIRRVFRIFPAFYTYLAAIFVLTLTGILSVPLPHLGVVSAHLANYYPLLVKTSKEGSWYLGHFWTLALEEQFYLLWPAALLLLGLRRGIWLIVAVCLLCPVLRVATYQLAPHTRGMTMMMLHTGADAIMLGCLVALLEGNQRFEKWTAFCRYPLTPWIAALLLVVVSGPLTYHFRGSYQLTVGRSIDSILMCVILFSLMRFPGTAAGRLANLRVLVTIGTLSYSLYLWQQLFLTSLNTTWLGVFPLNFAASFVAAYLSYRLVEQPFLSLRHRLEKRSAAKRQSTVAVTP